eukprot:TRINITY_DN8261_c0_g2_i1.p1 TRINITY_DN8261_c0_g2~~TRINITY_DN8261_c0_g2_i1.p1  ORF type:complete len:168 (+),score=36.38 TRINITY_DN8261_c0_g2_i1:39-506(+)
MHFSEPSASGEKKNSARQNNDARNTPSIFSPYQGERLLPPSFRGKWSVAMTIAWAIEDRYENWRIRDEICDGFIECVNEVLRFNEKTEIPHSEQWNGKSTKVFRKVLFYLKTLIEEATNLGNAVHSVQGERLFEDLLFQLLGRLSKIRITHGTNI